MSQWIRLLYFRRNRTRRYSRERRKTSRSERWRLCTVLRPRRNLPRIFPRRTAPFWKWPSTRLFRYRTSAARLFRSRTKRPSTSKRDCYTDAWLCRRGLCRKSAKRQVSTNARHTDRRRNVFTSRPVRTSHTCSTSSSLTTATVSFAGSTNVKYLTFIPYTFSTVDLVRDISSKTPLWKKLIDYSVIA